MTENNIQQRKLSLETHHYDGFLPHDSPLGKIIAYNLNKKSVNSATVGTFILELIDLKDNNGNIICPQEKSIISRRLTQCLMSWKTPENYDHTNKISADELLYTSAEVWNNLKIQSPNLLCDFAIEFFLQFEDMNTGMCPQGRVTRLWQFMMAYCEWHPAYLHFL